MLRLMTFNIRYGTAPDGNQAWAQRRSRAAQRIRAFDPDLLGLQECRYGAQANYLRAQLPGYTFIGEPRRGPGDSALEMAPLLYRTNRFRPLGQGTLWLSKTPNQPGSLWPGAAFVRTLTWARLELREAPGRVLAFFNAHLDYVDPQVTLAQAQLAARLMDEIAPDDPHLLVGDFNADKRSPAYAALVGTNGAGLLDAYRLVHPGGGLEEGTFHDYGRCDPPQAIDWVLVSADFSASGAFVDRSVVNRLYPSDHFPLAAVVDWRAE